MYEYSKTLSHLIFDSIHHILKPQFSPTETVRTANTRSTPTDGSLSINVLSIHYCSTGFMVSFQGWNISEGSNSFPLATDSYCSPYGPYTFCMWRNYLSKWCHRVAWPEKKWENVSSRRCRKRVSNQKQLQSGRIYQSMASKYSWG